MKKILIVEDDEGSARGLARYISVSGHLATTFIIGKDNSILDAEKEIKTNCYELILSDGLNGGWKDILACTGGSLEFVLLSGDEDVVQEARKQGVKAFNKTGDSDAFYDYLEKL